MFERIKVMSETMNQQLVSAINSLRQSYQQPKLLFESVDQYLASIKLIEGANILKVEHLQDISEMIETECKSYESEEAQLNGTETNLQINGERLKQLISDLRQEISAVKDIDSLKNTQDEFVFDLSKFQSTQQIEYQKVA